MLFCLSRNIFPHNRRPSFLSGEKYQKSIKKEIKKKKNMAFTHKHNRSIIHNIL